MKKSFVLFILLFTMLMVLATGCNRDKNKDVTTNAQQTTVKLFANFGIAEPGKCDRAYIQKLEEETGVKLEFDIPPSSGFAERLQLMLASGDYPDAVLFPEVNDQAYLNAVNQNILIPVNEYIKDAPDIMKHTYDFSWDALKTNNDENIYGIPRSSMVRNDGFVVRADWLENVGLKIPDDHSVTIDEFTEILHRFTKNDPDKNGKDDTYGIMITLDQNKVAIPIILSPFGCLNWQKYENEPYVYMNPLYSKVNNSYKNALAYTQDLYKKGYIDPASPSYTSKDVFQRFCSGNSVGFYYGFAGHMLNYEKELQKSVPTAKLDYLYIKNKDGKVAGSVSGTGFWGHWSITTAAKDPAAVVKVLNWIVSDEGWDYTVLGIEGVDYETVEGKYTIINQDESASWRSSFMRRAGDINFFAKTYLWDEEMRSRIMPIIEIGKNSVVLSEDRGYIPPVTKDISFINYSKTMDEVVSRILLNTAEVSEYNAALDGWYRNGGEEYIQQMNDYINKMSKATAN